jgi:hypothetical protein
MGRSLRFGWIGALVVIAGEAVPASAAEVIQECCFLKACVETRCCEPCPCRPLQCGPIHRLLALLHRPFCCHTPAPVACPPPVVPVASLPVPYPGPTVTPAPAPLPGPPDPRALPQPGPSVPRNGYEPGPAPSSLPGVPSARGSLPVPEYPLAPVPARPLTPALPPPPVRLEHLASLRRELPAEKGGGGAGN